MPLSTPFLKTAIITALALPLLTSCSAIFLAPIGLSEVEAVTVGSATFMTAAVATADKEDASRPKISGTYEHGFWFDRELYSVNVSSDDAELSERIAHTTATESCAKRGKSLRVLRSTPYKMHPPFASIFEDRFAYEMKFRCQSETVGLL